MQLKKRNCFLMMHEYKSRQCSLGLSNNVQVSLLLQRVRASEADGEQIELSGERTMTDWSGRLVFTNIK